MKKQVIKFVEKDKPDIKINTDLSLKIGPFKITGNINIKKEK